MAYTLLQLRQALAEEAFSGQFPIRLSTTAAGTASALTFGALAYGASGATVNEFHGCWLYNTAAVPVAPFSSRVLQQAGFAPTTGILTVAPAFGSAPGTAMEIIFCYDLHPDELHLAINRILRNLIHYAYLPVTLVADGDMEDTSATDHWAQIGTVTRTKFTNNLFAFGRQALSVSAADDGEGVETDDIPVAAGESMLLSAHVATAPGFSMVVRFRNKTAGGTIQSVTIPDTDGRPVEVRLDVNAPAGCREMGVQYVSATAGGTFYLGPQTVLSQNRKRYPLDSASIERSVDIKDLFKIPQGQNDVVSDAFYSFSEHPYGQLAG